MRFKILSIFIIILFVIGCNDKPKEEQEVANTAANNSHKVVIQEVVQATAYTYLRVKEDSQEYWMAITKREIENGATVYYKNGLKMENFESRDLNKTFDQIYFVEEISDKPMDSAHGMGGDMPAMQKPVVDKQDVKVEKASGGITIGELFSNKKDYAGKSVKIKGKVTKFNAEIMGKNWVHLQDGTNSNGDFDLTLTTQEKVKVGDVVTFEGVVVLDKDFGAGYAYAVLLEDSKLK